MERLSTVLIVTQSEFKPGCLPDSGSPTFNHYVILTLHCWYWFSVLLLIAYNVSSFFSISLTKDLPVLLVFAKNWQLSWSTPLYVCFLFLLFSPVSTLFFYYLWIYFSSVLVRNSIPFKKSFWRVEIFL